MTKRNYWLIVLGLVCAGIVLFAPDALAQAQTEQRFTGILDAFRDNSIRWQGTLVSIATWLFFTLAIIQFVWTNGMLALKGGDASDFVAINTKEILGIGVMYVFLVHSYTWSHALVKGFMQAGERAVLASTGGGAVGAMDPASIFEDGMTVAGSMFDQMSIWSGIDNLSIVICALVIIACFAFLAAYMAVVLVESYIIIGGAVLFLGFGGASWTSDIAKRAMMYAVSVGAKLFVMQLIVGVAMGSVVSWAQTFKQDSSTSTLSLIGLVMLITICAKNIPEIVQGVLSGVSAGGTASMIGTIAASVAAVGAGAAALGAAGAAGGAGAAAGGAGGAAAGGAAAGAAGAGAAGAGAAGGAGGGLFSGALGHLGRMGGHIVDAGTGMNPNAALGPLSSAAHATDGGGGNAPELGDKPTPPDGGGSSSAAAGAMASTSAASSASSASGDGGGGTIRGAGVGTATAAPGAPGGEASASGGKASTGAPAAAASLAEGAPTSTGGGRTGGGSGGSDTPGAAMNGASMSVGVPGTAPASSGQGGGTQSLDDRSGNGSTGGAGQAHLASSQLAEGIPSTSGAAPSNFGGTPQGLGEHVDGGTSTGGSENGRGAAADSLDAAPLASPSENSAPGGDSSITPPDPGARAQNAKRGALAGFLAAGPGGAAIGAAAGAALSPQIQSLSKRAAGALAAAKARFGLT